MSEDKIYLDCPFEEKNECKLLGGRWDKTEKKWYITNDMNIADFARWVSSAERAERNNTTDYNYPRARNKFEQIIVYINDLMESPNSIKASRSELERRLWNALDLAQKYLAKTLGENLSAIDKKSLDESLIAQLSIEPQNTGPSERASILNRLDEADWLKREKTEQLFEEVTYQDQQDMAKEYADENYWDYWLDYLDGLQVLFEKDIEDGWPYED